jgi:large subunit ribosomal protein L28
VAFRCEICGKAPASGSNVSFSERHTKRRFRPNIQSAKLVIGGVQKRMRVCTRCLRTHYKSAKEAAAPA